MKVAHLILVHKNPAQVQRLIGALDHPAAYFYLHIDRKTEASAFEFLGARQNVFLIKERVDVRWAGYGTIQATINGFKEILVEDYTYINVISGQDFPLKPADYFVQFLAESKGKEFITCSSMNEWSDGKKRVERISFVNWKMPGRFLLETAANALLPKRRFPLNFKLVGRSNWFTITSKAAQYILNFIADHPQVVQFFKYTWGADEVMMPTILYNSPFKDRISENLVYVDWTGRSDGHPKVLTMEDRSPLLQSKKLFARKFDMEVDEQIFSYLEEAMKSEMSSSLSS
jgi:hypothetical protein